MALFSTCFGKPLDTYQGAQNTSLQKMVHANYATARQGNMVSEEPFGAVIAQFECKSKVNSTGS